MTTLTTVASPTLRPATPGDIDAIARVWHDGWREAHLGHMPVGIERFRRLSDFRDRVARHLTATTVAADRNSRVVGFVMIHEDEVGQLYVAAQARGRGVADRLLRHGEQVISQRFDRAWLAVIDANPRARRFYNRSGWNDLGPFRHEADAGTGTITVLARRYEKSLPKELYER